MGGLSSGIDINNYLTIEALKDGLTASLSNNDCEYCVDGDGNWKTLSAGTATESINTGQTLSFRGNLTPSGTKGIGTFTIGKRCNLKGNCMSMLFGDNAANNYSLSGKSYAFYGLFKRCSNIVTVDGGFLPATTLSYDCYTSMFYNCSSLTTAPELPATTLATDCYYEMFYGCTSLTIAPKLHATTLARSCCYYMFYNCSSLITAPTLPATTLANYCYQYMFGNCRSLTSAPELPATTLADYCYDHMFGYCTALTTAPTLPATTLANYCYTSMFYNCSSLTTAPELPATQLTGYCYQYMFEVCSKLNYIKMLATDISATGCLNGWVNGVAGTGTFVKHPNMTTLSTGRSGIPSGWTVVNDREESGDNVPEFPLYLYTEEKQGYGVYHIEPCKETLALVDYFWENAVEGSAEWNLPLPASSVYIDGWELDCLTVFKNNPDRADFEVYKNYDDISMPRGQLYVTGEKKGLLEIYDES